MLDLSPGVKSPGTLAGMAKHTRTFGLGQPTGIGLPAEASGLVPTNEWKRRTKNEIYFTGELYQAGIGQGYNMSTPLQVLNSYAALANGGTIYKPQLVRKVVDQEGKLVERIQPEVVREMDVDKSVLRTMRQAARRVVTIRHTDNLVDLPIVVAGKSGTAEFLNQLTGDQQKDSNLIGQFGVGFYSSFIVADKVTVTSRRAGVDKSEAVRWESDGQGSFTLENTAKESRGTVVTLHLKEGEEEFADNFRLRNIIKTYSDHISLPVMMEKQDFGNAEEEGEEKFTLLLLFMNSLENSKFIYKEDIDILDIYENI